MHTFIVNPSVDQPRHAVTANSGADDPIRNRIVDDLRAAGVPTFNSSDEQLLAAYTAMICGPLQRELDSVNARLALKANLASLRVANGVDRHVGYSINHVQDGVLRAFQQKRQDDA